MIKSYILVISSYMNKVSYGFMNFIALFKVVSVHVPYKVYVSDTFKKK